MEVSHIKYTRMYIPPDIYKHRRDLSSCPVLDQRRTSLAARRAAGHGHSLCAAMAQVARCNARRSRPEPQEQVDHFVEPASRENSTDHNR